MEEYSKIGQWIEDLPKRGKSVFSKQEVENQFPALSYYSIRNSLYRLVKKKKIQSVWRDFYAVILPEYGLKGVAPPIEYIDKLMRFLGNDYYIALLSAAALQGAAHQAPMEFFVITNSRMLRDKQKGDVKINFVTKKNIPAPYITQIMANSGYVNISRPELTALDLVIYEKNVGGINRVATVLSELAETLDFSTISIEFLKSLNGAIIQRLGYLFDVLEFEELANVLFQKSKEADIKFRKYPLSILSEKRNYTDFQINDKWKIIINEEIDIDDL
ncbi:MAG: type IV toxin-antitoxin system AbiEi family antitoxin [Lentimicrobiaceae bacterium]|jgi:predicted transcriptional regulator of viral defense system|nr:type IV toxin-antitoxin system AbiEi family antitoxin [Lentimicrobiaceae bacterium]